MNRPVPYFDKRKMERDGVLRYAVQENHDYTVEENFYKEPIFDIGDTIIRDKLIDKWKLDDDILLAQATSPLTTSEDYNKGIEGWLNLYKKTGKCVIKRRKINFLPAQFKQKLRVRFGLGKGISNMQRGLLQASARIF